MAEIPTPPRKMPIAMAGSGSAPSRDARRPSERSDAAHDGVPLTRPAEPPAAASGPEGLPSSVDADA